MPSDINFSFLTTQLRGIVSKMQATRLQWSYFDPSWRFYFTPIGYEWGVLSEAETAVAAVGDGSEFDSFFEVSDNYGDGPSYLNDDYIYKQMLERKEAYVGRAVRMLQALDAVIRMTRGRSLASDLQILFDALIAAEEDVRTELGQVTFSSDTHKVPAGPLPPMIFVGEV